MTYRHIAFIFCRNLQRDPVANHILNRLLALRPAEPSGDQFDGHPIHRWQCPDTGVQFAFAASVDVVSHDYGRYLPQLNNCFGTCDFVGLVNWHEGANAPDRILCLHTTGDVSSGQFGSADPVAFTGILRSFFAVTQRIGCTYASLSEATHWSGMGFSGLANQITQFPVPVMDLEIGSSPASWSDPDAHTALATALLEFPLHLTPEAPAILCVGGVHFEQAFCSPLQNGNVKAYNLAHILPNQWLQMDRYTGSEGVGNILAAASSIRGGIRAITFHDNLKGPLKESVRAAAVSLGIPAFNHKVLRDPVRFANALPVSQPS